MSFLFYKSQMHGMWGCVCVCAWHRANVSIHMLSEKQFKFRDRVMLWNVWDCFLRLHSNNCNNFQLIFWFEYNKPKQWIDTLHLFSFLFYVRTVWFDIREIFRTKIGATHFIRKVTETSRELNYKNGPTARVFRFGHLPLLLRIMMLGCFRIFLFSAHTHTYK